MSGLTVSRPYKIGRSKAGGKQSALDARVRVPRVARLMALAIRFDQMIRDGVVADQAELARIGRVTRARVTQIINLLSLAPEIQEQILLCARSKRLTERHLRSMAATSDWEAQRQQWQAINSA